MEDKKGDFKPLYKTKYSSGGTLQNDIIPKEIVSDLFRGIKLIEADDPIGITITLSTLAIAIPPFKKFFKDYEKLKAELDVCRKLKNDWISKRRRKFPITLSNKLYLLYELWWEAYNDSGAGIMGEIYISRDKRIKAAIRNL